MNQKMKFLPYVLVALFMAVLTSCEKDDVNYDDVKQFGPDLHGPATYLKGVKAEQAKELFEWLNEQPAGKTKKQWLDSRF